MASVFPDALDSFATNKADGTATPTDHPGHHNDLADAVNKIEANAGLVFIAESVLGAGAASVSFSSIPQRYRDLLIVGEVRTNRAAESDGVLMQVGAGAVDSGGNYATLLVYSGAITGANQNAVVATNLPTATSFQCGVVAGDSADAGCFGSVEIHLLGYANAAHHRSQTARSGLYSGTTQVILNADASGRWVNAADAVDIVTLLPETGTEFMAGTRFTLLGRL